MTLPRTIALDGPAGSGKSSVSAVVARDLGYLFVDTGAFYRAVTLAAIRTGQVEAGESVLAEIAERSKMEVTPDRDADERDYTILLDGEDVTHAIRERKVEDHVSQVSALGSVRSILVRKQRLLTEQGYVLMVGRDIATVVLPDADLKIYLDASPEVRAERRYRQRIEAGQPADYAEILAMLKARDTYDSQREVSPFRRAPDAKYLTTDHLDVAEAIQAVKLIILDWRR